MMMLTPRAYAGMHATAKMTRVTDSRYRIIRFRLHIIDVAACATVGGKCVAQATAVVVARTRTNKCMNICVTYVLSH